MPQRKRYNRRGRRRRRRRKPYNKATISTMHPFVAPDRARVKLKFEQRASMTLTTGNVNYRTYRGNSLYDPDYTGTGTQPAGYDQWTALYNKYLVRASKMSVTVVSLDGNESEAETIELGLMPSPDFEYVTPDVQHIGTLPYGKFQIASFNGGPQRNIISNYMSTAKIWGVATSTVSGENAFSADISANPSNDWYWTVYLQPADEASTETYVLYVQITYYAEFFDRKILAPSLISEAMRYMSIQYDKHQEENRNKAKQIEFID